MVTRTRSHPDLELGLSPRGTLALFNAARMLAVIRGQEFVIPGYLKYLAPFIPAHRVIIAGEAAVRGVNGATVIREIIIRFQYRRRRLSMSNIMGFVIVLGLAALLSAVPGTYRIFYLGLTLLILIWWGLRTNSKRIKIREDLSGSSGFAGTALSLKVRITNPSWFPIFWGLVSKAFPEQLGTKFEQALVSIPPRGETVIQMAFYPQRRGIYPVPETRLSFGDPFGFKEIAIKAASPEKIIIYPPILPVVGLNLPRHFPLGQNRVIFGLHEDPSRPRGCRDYSPGDSIKKIHWPNLARTGCLKVKEWETTLTEEIAVFLNLAEEDYPVSDWSRLSELGIDFTASLVHLLIANKETLGFYCNGKTAGAESGIPFRVPPKHGYVQEKRIMHYLAGVDLNRGLGYAQVAQEAYQHADGSCLIFITPCLSGDLVKQAQNLKRLGYHPVVFWLRASAPSFIELERAKIPWHTVEKRRDHSAFHIS